MIKLVLNNSLYSKASLFNYLESNNFEKNKIEELYRIYRSERDGNKVQNSNIIAKADIEKLLLVYERLLKEVGRLLRWARKNTRKALKVLKKR